MKTRMYQKLVIVLTLCFVAACKAPNPQNAFDAESETCVSEVRAWGVGYRASTNWMQLFASGHPFTIELQRALLNPEPINVLTVAAIVDVHKEENLTIVIAEDDSAFLRYVLNCDDLIAEQILAGGRQEDRDFQQYAFVISPQSVSRPLFQLRDSRTDLAGASYADPFIVLSGTCVAIRALDNWIGLEDFLKYERPALD